MAFTGARCPAAPAWHSALSLPAGSRLRLGSPGAGLRSYLAVRGGFAVPAVLGSRSTDTLSGLGPAPLAAGDRLPVGHRCRRPANRSGDPGRAGSRPGCGWLPGPRADWFTGPAYQAC